MAVRGGVFMRCRGDLSVVCSFWPGSGWRARYFAHSQKYADGSARSKVPDPLPDPWTPL